MGTRSSTRSSSCTCWRVASGAIVIERVLHFVEIREIGRFEERFFLGAPSHGFEKDVTLACEGSVFGSLEVKVGEGRNAGFMVMICTKIWQYG